MSVPPASGSGAPAPAVPAAGDRPGSPARPLRVVMVIQRLRPYFSGHGVQVEGLCRELARRGVDVTILTAARGRHAGREEADGYDVHRLRSDVPGLPFTAKTTRFWAPVFGVRVLLWLWRRRHRIDVIHVHALTDALYSARWLARRRGIPLLFEMTLVGEDDPLSVRQGGNRLQGARWRAFADCDGYVAISPALAARYREAGLSDERLWIIPQAVDTARFEPPSDRPALRRELGLPEEAPVLVFVGSLVRRKGIDVLLHAWGLIHGRRPGARLVLVGKGTFDDEEARGFLDACLGRLDPGAREALVMPGLRDDPESWLQAADLFVFPSRREGFGAVIVEAMACGLPCVVAELEGITDFIFTGDEATVVPQEDPEALARAVLRILGADARRRQMGERARRRATVGFSFERIAGRYVDCYAALLEKRGRRPGRARQHARP